MKRIIFILIAVLINTIAFANANFDKTVNYQFNNAEAYEGETLYLMPLTGSSQININFTKREYYHSFMDNEKYSGKDYFTPSEYNYKSNVAAGTHKKYIEKHRFYVNEVTPIPNQKYIWVLHLTDLNTGDKIKYIYHGDGKMTGIDFEAFPFIVEKHLNYCKSLIGTNLVFATKDFSTCVLNIDNDRHWPFYEKDYITGEKINYCADYVKWKIKDVILDNYRSCICFIVSDGKHTAKVPYNIQYNTKHPKYNIGNRVFPEKQWNMLVNKYGESHMAKIMNTEELEDGTPEENYMSRGHRYFGKSTTINLRNTKNAAKELYKKFLKELHQLY